MVSLKLRLLGPFELTGKAGQPIMVSAKKSRGPLAVLALSPAVSRERLANLLWSDRGDAQARSSLRQALTSLRRNLGPDHDALLSADDERISIDSAHLETDAVLFQRPRSRVCTGCSSSPAIRASPIRASPWM
jgi:DNA-binding SARP family transcriptional activator